MRTLFEKNMEMEQPDMIAPFKDADGNYDTDIDLSWLTPAMLAEPPHDVNMIRRGGREWSNPNMMDICFAFKAQDNMLHIFEAHAVIRMNNDDTISTANLRLLDPKLTVDSVDYDSGYNIRLPRWMYARTMAMKMKAKRGMGVVNHYAEAVDLMDDKSIKADMAYETKVFKALKKIPKIFKKEGIGMPEGFEDDINARSSLGNTALALASFYALSKAVKILLDAGADPNIANNMGRGALEMACITDYRPQGSYDIIAMLKKHGARRT